MRSMDPHRTRQQFHESRADQEQARAEGALTEQARRSHARLAALHREQADLLGMWSGAMPTRAEPG
ncbi:MAG TPA: hypothetical protein VFK58_08255 [Sphingomicrobium sp.]|nr:hypothetical protein [Sphingomicrobium sp.]